MSSLSLARITGIHYLAIALVIEVGSSTTVPLLSIRFAANGGVLSMPDSRENKMFGISHSIVLCSHTGIFFRECRKNVLGVYTSRQKRVAPQFLKTLAARLRIRSTERNVRRNCKKVGGKKRTVILACHIFRRKRIDRVQLRKTLIIDAIFCAGKQG